MSKKIQNQNKKPAKIEKKAVQRLILLLLVTVAVALFYRVMMNFYYFEIVLIAYMVLFTALIVAYLIYNRGFTRRGVTREMLPADWSEEKKTEFLEDRDRRLLRSRWMIIPMFAFVVTFAMDAIELFVLPFFIDLFTK